MPFSDFLKLCMVLRSIYGKEVSQAVFEANVAKYYNLGKFDPKKVLQDNSACANIELANA